MKIKQKTDICASILFMMVGIILLLCPLLKINNINFIFITIMFTLGIVNGARFILTSKFKDVEGLLSGLSSFIIGIVAFFYNVGESPMNLAVLLFVWIIVISLIKLKKADYYNDRKSKIWILEISFLIIFVIAGILTCLNLSYAKEVEILMMGFFFFLYGILEFINPIIIYLTKEKIK